jgi:hypothetical protein
MSPTERVRLYGLKNEGLYRKLRDLISTQVSDDDVRRLADSSAELPVRYQDRSEFTNRVLEHIISAFVASGDRGSLVNLLSQRFVPRVGIGETIELRLAFRGNRLNDPILVLGEAYSKCTIPSVRHDIAAAVRRGFTDLGIRGEDDADFVKKAMRWYEKEKSDLVPNIAYVQNDDDFPVEQYGEDPSSYERNASRREPLFKRKATGVRPNRGQNYFPSP